MSVDELKIVRMVFERMLNAPNEMLSKADLQIIVGKYDYDRVKGALLATEKVEGVTGRAGGISIRRAKGNRRKWTNAAESKARSFLASNQPAGNDESPLDAPKEHMKRPIAAPRRARNDEGPLDALKAVNVYWPQSRIAEALGVSQASISNWLRTEDVPDKYAEAVRQLSDELQVTSKGRKSSVKEAEHERSLYGDWLRNELDQRQSNAVDLAARAGIHINTILALLEGRTERPQQRTRKCIEKALQDVAPSEGAPTIEGPVEQESWYYIGLPWTQDEINQVPDAPGVYIIHDRLGRPAYVGVAYKGAGGIRARLKKHNDLRWTSDQRVANSFSYAIADKIPRENPSDLAKALEKLLIKFMGNAILINERDVEDLAK